MAEISGLSFGSTIDTLGNSLVGASMQNEQIANNIANANTPGFHRSSVSFKDALAAAVDGPATDPDTLPMTADDDRQFGMMTGPVPFDPKPVTDDQMKMRADGSNVDVDREMAELSSNSGYQQTMAQLLQTQYTRLREAITEQPK